EQDYLLAIPSRIICWLYRAGLSAGCTEQRRWLMIPSRSGFGPARGPVQNNYQMEFGGPSRQIDEQQQPNQDEQQQQQQQQPNQCLKKGNYRRHTQEQIEELDA
ncbi:hypothetical protein A2U01_0059828, partial [Trifolium medium]|nr:hypothetical protein [Trifolium medium]